MIHNADEDDNCPVHGQPDLPDLSALVVLAEWMRDNNEPEWADVVDCTIGLITALIFDLEMITAPQCNRRLMGVPDVENR